MKMSELSLLFKCLSDPVRCRILNLLFHEELICVCDIVSCLELPQSVVSRHLAYLRKHGLVSAERRGNWQYYSHTFGGIGPRHDENAKDCESAESDKTDSASAMIREFKKLLKQEPDCQQDVMKLVKDNGCC